MNILIITPSYKPAFVYGGPIFSVAYLSENLSIDNNVLVLSTKANGRTELNISTSEVQNVDGVKVLFFKRQTKDHTHLSFGLLSYLWKNGSKYDVIHIQSWWNLASVLSALICKLKSWNYVVSPRGMLSPYTYQDSILKKTIHFTIGNLLLKNSKIHLTSIDEQTKVLDLNSTYKTFVVPNYINSNIPAINKTKSKTFRILFIGRIHPKKGLDVLLKALNMLNFTFQLNIVGNGETNYLMSLKKLIKHYNLIDNVFWLGAKYDFEKFELYANSDLMVLPSHDENFANSVLESLMLGTPVLLSSNVGLSDFVQKNNLGWVYQGNENELVNCINDAYFDVEKREHINNTSREIVLNEYNSSKITQKYLYNYFK
jgi:glycosyltransferase involved in cell wall biosynthesis